MKAEMSEVDRLSNSGLYPVLPMGDRKSQRDHARHPPTADSAPDGANAKDGDSPPSDPPRPPKSLIDEYA
jgi:hypothetical protein